MPAKIEDGRAGVHDSDPDLSLVMPCYNEEDVAGRTIERLVDAFRQGEHQLEIVAVDNGSEDSTGEVLRTCQARFPEVRVVQVAENRGYGNGVLAGLPHCDAPWAGIIPADGQVDAEDVVRLFEEALATDGRAVVKVRRRFRMDGLRRKLISVAYNLFFRLLWPGIGSLDVNGSPKLCRREMLEEMRLHSEGWLLDPEIMVKAHHMQLRIVELNVFARLRSGGQSHVELSAIWEFFRALLAFRVAPGRSLWREGSGRFRRSHVSGEGACRDRSLRREGDGEELSRTSL